MTEQGARQILPLPEKTTSALRTSLVLPSLPAVLCELVQNALDAQANTIAVSFDLDRWTIKCDDNGLGLSRSELAKIGKRYWTSKLDGSARSIERVETFGFRGEALASIAEASLLEVVSRRDEGGREGETVTLVMRGGDRVSEGISRTQRASRGTTIWARDIFYKWPVRRKPLSTPSARLALITSLRQSFTTLALLHPEVSFDLIDLSEVSPKQLISVKGSKEGVIGRWRQLWGRAGVENVWSFERAEQALGASPLKVEGFFSMTASHSKANQFIYVNSRPLALSPLHKLINSLFSSSSFARHSSSFLTASTIPSFDLPSSHTATTKASRKSPKKVAERYPIFVLNLRVDTAMIDVTLEPEKRVVEFQEEKKVFDFIESLVVEFLRSQNFLATPSPATQTLVAGTSRIATPSFLPLPIPPERAPTPAPPPKRFRQTPPVAPITINQSASSSRLPAPNATASTYPVGSGGGEDVDQPIKWKDPNTLQTFLIDKRTGNTWRPPEKEDGCGDCRGDHRGEKGLVDRSGLKRRERSGEDKEERPPPQWMVNTLENWENPVFANTDQAVTTLRPVPHDKQPGPTPFRSSKPFATSSKARNLSHDPTKLPSVCRTIHNYFSSHTTVNSVEASYKFSKESLMSAEVIAQVDRKFILVRLNPIEDKGTTTLVMVDQHAADERIRVEKMLAELCSAVANGEPVATFNFENRVGVVVSTTEKSLLRESLDAFEQWGIRIELGDDTTGPSATSSGSDINPTDYEQVYITSVPLVVSDRLKVENQLQQELVRTYLVNLSEGPIRRWKAGVDWSTVAKDCPPVVLDLINSKACRGAIMFNDELSLDQCRSLITRLATTKFPFQCAHGRPSLTPLVNLANTEVKPHRINWENWK